MIECLMRNNLMLQAILMNLVDEKKYNYIMREIDQLVEKTLKDEKNKK